MTHPYTRTSIAVAVSCILMLASIATSRVGAADAVPTSVPAATSPAIDVDRFNSAVAKLADEAFVTRSAARDELAAMSDAIEPQLKALLGRRGLDPETQAAVESLIERIAVERERGPARVTLERKAAPAKDVFDELARQGNIKFAAGVENLLSDPARGTFDVQFARTPFWDALLDACAKSRLAFRGIESDRVSLEPVADGAVSTPIATSGPFIVSIARVETNVSKAIAFGGPRPMNALNNRMAAPPCQLYLFGWSEPRMKPIHWVVDSIDECTTDAGGNLAGLNRAAGRPFMGMSGRPNALSEIQLALGAPPQGARKIVSLKLASRFVISRGMDKLELADPLTLKNRQTTLAGMDVIIRSVNRLTDSQYNYEVSLQRGTKSPAEWSMITTIYFQYPCRLVDAEGRVFSQRGGSTSSRGTSIDITQTFNAPAGNGPPAKLVWEFPDNLQHIVAPLEFHDVPLP